MAALATSAVPAMDHPWPLQLLGEHLAPSPGQHRGQHEAPLRVREGWSCDRDRWQEEGQGGAGTAPAPSEEPAQIPGDAVVANAPASPQSPAGPGEGGEALAIASTTGCAGSAGPCQGLIRLVPFPRRPLGRLRLGGGIRGWDGKEKPVVRRDRRGGSVAHMRRGLGLGSAPAGRLLPPGPGTSPGEAMGAPGAAHRIRVGGASPPGVSTSLPATSCLPWEQPGAGGERGHVCHRSPWPVPAGAAIAGEPLPGRTVQGAELKIMRKFSLPEACSGVAPSSASPAPGSSGANTGVLLRCCAPPRVLLPVPARLRSAPQRCAMDVGSP